jgi:hypothetical protein
MGKGDSARSEITPTASSDCDMLSENEARTMARVSNSFGEGQDKMTVFLLEKDDDEDEEEEESLLNLFKLFSALIISREIRVLSYSALLPLQYIVCGTGDSVFNLQAAST